MKTKEEIIAVIDSTNHLSCDDCVAIKHHLTQPTLNPNKIDEERMATCFEEVFTKDIYAKSNFKTIVDKYNSTCKDHQVLQPLPKDKPDWFEWSLDTSKYDLWDELVKTYGTPTKKELVSVEELAKEIKNIYVPCSEEKKLSYVIAQHLVNKYGLNPPNRDEFPFNLKKGDKFMGGGREFILEKLETTPRLYTRTGYFEATDCTPYIEPSIHDKFMASLSDEQKKMYEEMKEVKG